MTKLYVRLDSVTRLLSDRINVSAPYSPPLSFHPPSLPQALFYVIENDSIFSRATCSFRVLNFTSLLLRILRGILKLPHLRKFLQRRNKKKEKEEVDRQGQQIMEKSS